MGSRILLGGFLVIAVLIPGTALADPDDEGDAGRYARIEADLRGEEKCVHPCEGMRYQLLYELTSGKIIAMEMRPERHQGGLHNPAGTALLDVTKSPLIPELVVALDQYEVDVLSKGLRRKGSSDTSEGSMIGTAGGTGMGGPTGLGLGLLLVAAIIGVARRRRSPAPAVAQRVPQL